MSKITEKIAKLLALAESPYEEEAKAALLQARRLMAEHINNSPETAPSKRLEALIPGYAKVKNGTQLSEAMGLGAIMAQCPHFKKWIEDMVAW